MFRLPHKHSQRPESPRDPPNERENDDFIKKYCKFKYLCTAEKSHEATDTNTTR